MGACHQQFYNPKQLGYCCQNWLSLPAPGLCLRSDLDVRAHHNSKHQKRVFLELRQCLNNKPRWFLGTKEISPAANPEEINLDAEEDHVTKSLGAEIRSTVEDQSQNIWKPSSEGAEGHRMAPGISVQKLSRVCFLF